MRVLLILLAVFLGGLILYSNLILAQGTYQNPSSGTGDYQNPPSGSGTYINPQSESVDLLNPLGKTTTVYALLQSIIEWLIRAGAAIAALMIVVGAFQMLFSGGDPERFKKGRQTILYTAIGYGIILLAWSIAALIRNILQ